MNFTTEEEKTINSPYHELDFLLRSLNTSETDTKTDNSINEFQTIRNYSFSDYSPIPVQFIDQTPSPYSAFSPILPTSDNDCTSIHTDTIQYNKRRKRNVERPIDLDRSRIAQRRKRDDSGKFLKKEVALKIEELEQKLREKEEECNNLRQTLSTKEQELAALRSQLQNQSHIMNHSYYPPVSFPSVPMINLPSRNYVLIPNPNPQQIPTEKREAFKQKIDYSKIQLRKTDSLLDDEKREVLLSQEQWEEQRRLQEFLRKLEEQQRWYDFEFSDVSPVPQHTPLYGGPPSNIYSPPTKIGNLQVPAFTTKVDFTTKREELGKKEARNKQYILVDQPNTKFQSKPSRHARRVSMGKFPVQAPEHETEESISLKNLQPYQLLSGWDSTQEEMDLETTSSYHVPRQFSLGGPPSNIYTPPSKIGNLAVPAFTQKIDFSEIELRKTEGPYSSSPPL